MKWTRKKKSPSLISRVFPVSWFSRFTHKRGDRDADTAQLSNDAAALDLLPPIPCRKGRFYSMDENDAFWRISFGEDNRIPPRRSCGAAVERDLGNPNLPDFKHLRLGEGGEVSTKGEFRNFSEMVSDVKKMREKEKAKHVRDSRQILPVETKTKSEPSKRRESSKGYNCNFKAYSPRTEFKIRALEEMKRSRTRRARKERVDSVFDSFAVVKSSVDPQRDFKDSMVEMIREKGIRHEDELEQLLACYLTLNCDEYHDLIIGVFRQVWIEQQRLC